MLVEIVLPMAIHDLLHVALRARIMRLSTVFQKLFARVIDPTKILWMYTFIVETCAM